MPKKIQVNFDDSALDVLDDLKNATPQGSYADVIRNAIGLYEWARQEYAQGNAIGVIRDGKAVREVVLPAFTVLSNQKVSTERKPISGRSNQSNNQSTNVAYSS